MKFPSPCGEKVGINLRQCGIPPKFRVGVSVPLRGKGRDQLKFFGTDGRYIIAIVSVPLRGKGRDQQFGGHHQSVEDKVVVSVPLRGKGRDQPAYELIYTT